MQNEAGWKFVVNHGSTISLPNVLSGADPLRFNLHAQTRVLPAVREIRLSIVDPQSGMAKYRPEPGAKNGQYAGPELVFNGETSLGRYHSRPVTVVRKAYHGVKKRAPWVERFRSPIGIRAALRERSLSVIWSVKEPVLHRELSALASCAEGLAANLGVGADRMVVSYLENSLEGRKPRKVVARLGSLIKRGLALDAREPPFTPLGVDSSEAFAQARAAAGMKDALNHSRGHSFLVTIVPNRLIHVSIRPQGSDETQMRKAALERLSRIIESSGVEPIHIRALGNLGAVSAPLIESAATRRPLQTPHRKEPNAYHIIVGDEVPNEWRSQVFRAVEEAVRTRFGPGIPPLVKVSEMSPQRGPKIVSRRLSQLANSPGRR